MIILKALLRIGLIVEDIVYPQTNILYQKLIIINYLCMR